MPLIMFINHHSGTTRLLARSSMFILTARHILANIYHSPFWWLGLAGCHASGVRRLDFGCVAVTFGWINKRGGTVPPQPSIPSSSHIIYSSNSTHTLIRRHSPLGHSTSDLTLALPTSSIISALYIRIRYIGSAA